MSLYRGALNSGKSVILIKKEEASLAEFLTMLDIYRLKYPSHFGFFIWNSTTKKYKVMDSVWWSFKQFKDSLERYAKWDDIIVVCMTILCSANASKLPFFKIAETTSPLRIFNLSGIYGTTMYASDSSNKPETKILVFTGEVYYKGERVSPRSFLEKLTQTQKFFEFQKDPLEWMRDIKNTCSLSVGDKICLFNPSNEDGSLLQYFKAFENDKGMVILSNNIIVSDPFPNKSLIDVSDEDVVDNMTNGVIQPYSLNEVSPTPRNILNRIEDEWETFNFKPIKMQALITEIKSEQRRLNGFKRETPIRETLMDRYPNSDYYANKTHSRVIPNSTVDDVDKNPDDAFGMIYGDNYMG